jgi:predicted ester cyclase
MSRTNAQIVREYIEEVGNRQHYDRTFDFCSRDCVVHGSPYVGLGCNFDDRSGDKIVITDIAPGGPAAGILHAKDELVRVVDKEKSWETFQDLKTGLWGQGVLGSPVTVTIKRGEKLLEIPMKRGRIEGLDFNVATSMEIWKDYTLKYWPDLKSEIKLVIAEGDLVATYVVNSGTNLEYNHSAVWDECDIYRLKDEKIIEIWGIENNSVLQKQLGYQIIPPLH